MPKIKVEIPKDYLCPITHEFMTDPVITVDGHAYERKAIEKWLQHHDTSPVTNLKLKSKELTSVSFIKKQMQFFLEENQLCTQEKFFKAVFEASIERSALYKIQKLNYLDSYLTAKRESDGFTVLHIAVSCGHTDMVAWLLAEGAKPNIKDNNDATPLHIATRTEIAKLLLAEGADLKAINNKGETPLHFAASYGRAEVVELFLEKGADLQAKDNQGYTPEGSHEVTASLCLKPPGDYNKTKYLLLSKQPNVEAEYGSQLHLAIYHKQVDEAKFLLYLMCEDREYSKLEAKDKHGWTPLNLAASRGLVEIVKLLLAEKVNLETKTNFLGKTYTPLHHAASKGHKEIVQLLLEYGADMNACDQNNLTPSQVAEKNGKVEIVKLFQLYEAPKKIAELEKTTQQQNQLIQRMETQIAELTQQLQRLTRKHQKNNSETYKVKNYPPSFNLSNKK